MFDFLEELELDDTLNIDEPYSNDYICLSDPTDQCNEDASNIIDQSIDNSMQLQENENAPDFTNLSSDDHSPQENENDPNFMNPSSDDHSPQENENDPNFTNPSSDDHSSQENENVSDFTNLSFDDHSTINESTDCFLNQVHYQVDQNSKYLYDIRRPGHLEHVIYSIYNDCKERMNKVMMQEILRLIFQVNNINFDDFSRKTKREIGLSYLCCRIYSSMIIRTFKIFKDLGIANYEEDRKYMRFIKENSKILKAKGIKGRGGRLFVPDHLKGKENLDFVIAGPGELAHKYYKEKFSLVEEEVRKRLS